MFTKRPASPHTVAVSSSNLATQALLTPARYVYHGVGRPRQVDTPTSTVVCVSGVAALPLITPRCRAAVDEPGDANLPPGPGASVNIRYNKTPARDVCHVCRQVDNPAVVGVGEVAAGVLGSPRCRASVVEPSDASVASARDLARDVCHVCKESAVVLFRATVGRC